MQENYEGKFNWEKDAQLSFKPNYSTTKSSGIREQLGWMKRQLEYYRFSERFKTRYDCKRGDIYEIDWGVNVNAEFSSRHYGVVLVDSNPYNPLVIVCPLKSNHQGAHPRSDVDLGYIEELNTYTPTLAVVNQIRSIDKLRIYTKTAIGYESNSVAENGEEEISKMDNIKINPSINGSVPRLNEEKMSLIIKAYVSLILQNGVK